MIRGAQSIPPTAGGAAPRVTPVACLFYAAFGAFLQWFPVWLIDARGFTGGQLGLAIAWAGIGRIFVGPLTSAWAEGRRDRRAPLLLLAESIQRGTSIGSEEIDKGRYQRKY